MAGGQSRWKGGRIQCAGQLAQGTDAKMENRRRRWRGTPALVGDKVFVFSRQDGNEVTRCLDAASGKELWSDQYPALGVNGPASGFSGPRASPAVADGKVVTLGIHGVLRASMPPPERRSGGKTISPAKCPGSTHPVRPSSSTECASRNSAGSVTVESSPTTWRPERRSGNGPGMAPHTRRLVSCPSMAQKLIIAETEQKIVAVSAADGKLAWETSFAAQGNGGV